MVLKLGQRSSRSLQITKEMIEIYAKMTGDYNPLHFDEEFTSKTKFGKLIAQGGLITGVLNAIVAMDLPGPGSVFLNQNLQFLGPAFIGDKLTGFVEVTGLHKTKPVTNIDVKVINQDEKLILEGTAICYTMIPKK